jgi:hypothetical protein
MLRIERNAMAVLDWLLDSDPSIRWQVMRDLTDEPPEVVAAERSKVATEGWGAQLLALQGPDGQWGGRAWSPEWTDTFHTLGLLRLLGLDPASEELRAAGAVANERVADAAGLVEKRRGEDGRWPLENPHPGEVHFDMDEGESKPSRWNTLRAMRVLRWYEQGRPTPQ